MQSSASVPRPAPAPHRQQQQQQQGVRLYDAPSNGNAPSRAPLPYAYATTSALTGTSDANTTGDVYFTSAQVVDSRISYTDDNRRFVEYKLAIETNARGTLFAWHRYSVFLQLAATLQLRDDSSGHDYRHVIPRLPSKKLFNNFADATISARVEKLNWFLKAAVGAEFLEWGIRVDDGTCVYKRSAAKSTTNNSSDGRDSLTSNTSTVGSASPRRRRLSRLSLKAFGFRRSSTAE